MSEQSECTRHERQHYARTSAPAWSAPAKSASLNLLNFPTRPNAVKQLPNAVSGSVEPKAAAVQAQSHRSPDAVMLRLTEALDAAERDGARSTEVYADALRLAIRARMVDLQGALHGDAGSVSDNKTPLERRPLQKWRLRRVVEYVDDHLSAKVTLSELAAAAGLSRMHFAAQFRAATGFRPHEYLLRRRVQLAEELLRHSSMSIVEIALTVGFQTQAHFTTVFKRFAGSTPYRWRAVRSDEA